MALTFLIVTSLIVSLLMTRVTGNEQHETHTIIIDSTKGSARLFAFKLNLPYDFNFSFTILPHAKYDPNGTSLHEIIGMRFIYLYFVNDSGGIDFFPFVTPQLYLTGRKMWFRPGTEVRLAYVVDTSTTEFFLPGFLQRMHRKQIQIITRFHVAASFDLRLSK